MKYTQKIKQFIRLRLPAVGLMSLLVAVALPLAVFAWGPSRPTFTTQKPATYVTFNSITNNPAHGDERNFMQIREATANNNTYADEISLQAGKEYVVYMYYHNNAAENYNASGKGIATGASVKAQIPSVIKKGSAGTKGVGYVSASNAKPTQVWDDISFKNTTSADLKLSYVPGSATIHSKGPVNGQKLSDSIIGSGASLGYDKLDGKLPGCHEYAGYVTFRVKTSGEPNFTMKKQVRKDGDTGWKDSISGLKPGDIVQYMISYKNTGTTRQNGVTVKDTLPKGMTYVNGSTVLTNASNPNGRTVADGVASNGVNIGNYAPGAAAYVTFKARVVKGEELECGKNKLKNRATVTTPDGSKGDDADVEVNVDCKPDECKPGIPEGDERCEDTPVVPDELPTTGPAQIIAGILGVALVSLGVAYWIRSRNEYKKALAGFTEDFTEQPAEHLLEAKTDEKGHTHASRFHK